MKTNLMIISKGCFVGFVQPGRIRGRTPDKLVVRHNGMGTGTGMDMDKSTNWNSIVMR